MKMILKFKDGTEKSRDFPNGVTIEGGQNLFTRLKDISEHDGDMIFHTTGSDEKEIRKFSDLYSIEIIL